MFVRVCVYRSAIVCRFLISSTWLIRACTAPTNCIFKYPLSHLLFNMLLLLWKCNKMPKRLTCHPINCGCSRFVCDLNRCTLFKSLDDFRAVKISLVASKASFIQSKFHGRIAIWFSQVKCWRKEHASSPHITNQLECIGKWIAFRAATLYNL